MRALLFLILLGLQACKGELERPEPVGNGNSNPPTLPQQKPPPASPPLTNPSQIDPSQTDPTQTDPELEPVNPAQTAIDPSSNGNSAVEPPPTTTGNSAGSSQDTSKTATASNPFYVQDSSGQNAASMTVSYEILTDGSVLVYLKFVALTALNDRGVGFPYHRLTIDFPQGDWKASKIVRNGHFRSSYYRIDSKSKKRDHFRIVLQALPQGANFQLTFAIPSTIVKGLLDGFELSLAMPYRQGRTFNFRDVKGNSPAQLFRGL